MDLGRCAVRSPARYHLDRGGRGAILAPAGGLAERPDSRSALRGRTGCQRRRSGFPAPGPSTSASGYHQLPARVRAPRGPGFRRHGPGTHVAQDDRAHRPRACSPPTARRRRPGWSCATAAAQPLARRALPRAHLRALRSGAAAAGRLAAVHREPRTARPAVPDAQPGDRVGPLRQGGWSTRRCIGSTESHAAAGGSTLATQIEKYRHSPDGRTDSGKEKLRQMASASLRAYLDGENTLPRRRQIVVDYLNTVPLSAMAGFGEVNGIGDGLWAWYGRDFAEVNRLLVRAPRTTTQPRIGSRARRAGLQAGAVADGRAAPALVLPRRRRAGAAPADRQLPAPAGRGRRHHGRRCATPRCRWTWSCSRSAAVARPRLPSSSARRPMRCAASCRRCWRCRAPTTSTGST